MSDPRDLRDQIEPPESGPDLKRSLTAMSFLGVGLSFMAEVGSLGFFGYWIDQRWGSSPWLMVVGIAAGMVLALTHLLRSADRYEQERLARKRGHEDDAGDDEHDA